MQKENFLFFSIRIYIQFCRNILNNHQNFVSKKNLSHQFFNFFQNPCVYLFFIQKRSFSHKDFAKNNFFGELHFFWRILYFLHKMRKFSKNRRKIYQKLFLTQQLELWRILLMYINHKNNFFILLKSPNWHYNNFNMGSSSKFWKIR